MGEEDGRRETVAYLKHPQRSLCDEAVGSLRLLGLLRVSPHLGDFASFLRLGLALLLLLLGPNQLLHLLRLRPTDVVRLPGALEGVQELVQAHVPLHELLQQLL